MIYHAYPPVLSLDADLTAYRRLFYTAEPTRLRRAWLQATRGLTGPVSVGAVGGDVSVWQEEVDWPKARAGTPAAGAPGWAFVFVRWLFGTYADTRAPGHWAGAGNAGLKRGAYAYYLDHQDPETQAEKLHLLLSDAGMGELPVVGDFEAFSNPKLTVARVKAYLIALEDLFGYPPFIYTGSPVWKKYFGSASWAKKYPLWLAQYTLKGWQEDHLRKVVNYPPSVPAPWYLWNADPAEGFGEMGVWQIVASCPAELYGVSGNVVDLDLASPWFAAQYLDGGPGDPPPAHGEFMAKFKVLSDILYVRKLPKYGSEIVGQLHKNDLITAVDVYPEDADSVWVKLGENQHAALVHGGFVYLEHVNE